MMLGQCLLVAVVAVFLPSALGFIPIPRDLERDPGDPGIPRPPDGYRLCNPPCLRGFCLVGRCRCLAGYTGRSCATPPPTCYPGCINGGICQRGSCNCQHPYTGRNCQTCKCQNGGRCEKGRCLCRSGYTGALCQDSVKPGRCPPSLLRAIPCLIRAQCTSDNQCPGSKKCCSSPCPGTCQCPIVPCAVRCAYGQRRDRSGCLICQCNPPPTCYPSCSNGGRCISTNRCQCPSGFTGNRCQTRIPPSCYPACQNGGLCFAPNRCLCHSGFTGNQCQTSTTPSCYPACQNGGRCIAPNRCLCRSGFTGSRCQTSTTPSCYPACQNGGRCIAPNRCLCRPGFTGNRCQTRIISYPTCYPSCQNGGFCIAPNRCLCRGGFTGNRCQTPITIGCSPRCQNGGICIPTNRCLCRGGFTGNRCQTPITTGCSPSCLNLGRCVNGACQCRPGYTGSRCETPVCSPSCRNGGLCVSPNRCSCPPGFTGNLCQTAVGTECTGEGTVVRHCGETCTCRNGLRVDCCRIRKEIHDMTQAERQLFINTYKAAYSRPDLRALLQSHETNFNSGIHTRNQFLPWHRCFILRLENILREVNCNVVMPYWDWTIQSANPWNAPVWSGLSHYYGGNGNGGCVTSGPFRQGQFTRVTGGCLRRGFQGTCPSAVTVNDVLNTSPSSANDFELRMRGQLHNTVHCRIGGTMCSGKAAEAPEFFLHHTFIDKLWDDWQKKSSAHRNAIFSTLTSPMTASNGYSARQCSLIGSQPGGVCARYQQPQSSSSRRLRTVFKRVPPTVIARNLPCQAADRHQSSAIEQGRVLFRVSGEEQSRLSSFQQKQVCVTPAARGPIAGQPRPDKQPPPPEAVSRDLGFSLDALEVLALAPQETPVHVRDILPREPLGVLH